MKVTVDGNKIIKLTGFNEHPVSHGHLCGKGVSAIIFKECAE
ncbi:hypothetical protein [Vulcanisaeta thermophila]